MSTTPPTLENLTASECELIFTLAERLTGTRQDAGARRPILLANVWRRMRSQDKTRLADYLAVARDSETEYAQLISALTIHTTSWFREMPHYERLEEHILKNQTLFSGRKFRLLSAACSTGEEAFSAALVLESVRAKIPGFSYEIEGFDIDPVSVHTASKAVFPSEGLWQVPRRFHQHLKVGSGPTTGLFTLDGPLVKSCSFWRGSLLGEELAQHGRFDWIMCRNVLIYFAADAVPKLVTKLTRALSPQGILCLGHSEAIDANRLELKTLGHTLYTPKKVTLTAENTGTPATSRLRSLPAPHPASLRDASTYSPENRVASKETAQTLFRPDLIVVGSSTGGTEVLVKMFRDMPPWSPPLIVVQHIAQNFTRQFAERLAAAAGLKLGDPATVPQLLPGHIYLAQGDYHIEVERRGGLLHLRSQTGDFVHGVRPSVDILFASIAKLKEMPAVAAVILTGMGKDGAHGLAQLKERGAITFVQDEASSVVFGMPREAINRGAAGFIGNPDRIREQLDSALKSTREKRGA